MASVTLAIRLTKRALARRSDTDGAIHQTPNDGVRPVLACHDRVVTDWREEDVDRAPICPQCGVTTLAADIATVLDSRFICENPDCEGFGENVDCR